MTQKNGFLKARQRITEAFRQATGSFRILQTLERETRAKARALIRFPNLASQTRMTNERFLSGLRRIGFATQDEVAALQTKVRRLEAAVVTKRPVRSAKTGKSAAK